MGVELDKLQAKLSYQFKDQNLVRLALTHRSASKTHNERLEFLGDALLDFIVAETLYENLPQASEGELTRMRAALVKKATLAEMARSIQLGEHILLSKGEAGSGGRERAAVLADSLEAVIAAVYLDGGLNASKALVGQLAGSRLTESKSADVKDSKTQLQELLQAKGAELPAYSVVETAGEAHAQVFKVACLVTLLSAPQYGTGNSKREAEQEAAASALLILKNMEAS